MSMIGELSHFLGLQISQTRAGLCISQTKYLKDMLKKYGMEDCAPMSTPMTTNCKLSKDDDFPLVDASHYRSMIGALLYLTATRPDIMQAVGMVGRFQSAPKKSHLLAVKGILRYLKGTSDFGLWYPKNSTLTVTTYTDVDWARSIDDRKSTSGNAFFLGDCLVSWIVIDVNMAIFKEGDRAIEEEQTAIGATEQAEQSRKRSRPSQEEPSGA
eukprot:PITA_19172